MLRKLLSHAAIYGLAAQLPRVAGVLALPVITPYLTTTDYGVAGVVTAYVTAMSVVQSLGLSVVMVNAFVKHPTRYKWVWRQVGGLMSIWTLVFGLIYFIVLYFATPQEADEHRLQIALLFSVPTMLFTTAEVQSNLYYQLAQKPLVFALRSVLVGMVAVGVNIYTIAYLKLGYMGWFYGNFFAVSLAFIFSAYTAYYSLQLWPIFKFKWKQVKTILAVSLPVLPHYFASGMLVTSDRLVLSRMNVPVPQIGLYSLAATFGSYFNQLSVAISEAANPFYLQLLSKRNEKSKLTARDLTFALGVVFLIATFTASLWMKEVFQILLRNQQLQKAYPIAIILLMGYNFRPFYIVVNNFLLYYEKTNKLWRISAVAVAGNITLTVLLVPFFGYKAAAFTTFAALLYMGFGGMWLKEFSNHNPIPYYPLRWLLVHVLFTGFAYFGADLSLSLKSAITGIIFLVSGMLYLKYKNNLHQLSLR
ncbi:lipopolysaccharide biosynthesis protein [Pontibacter anaerobius]|uniref:Lipopolysaccharide biosynthesis protein n=1 Tax=Pontibacter anaerobius TaxID=2993940 RepID=A0ABT3R9W2_9BACT|nr:lipopolysaccharide biosynthesis protein [Pontibacter anaerobius]MCX2738617.1 lipopolysaccharide biosynthesis protein [Pontibacter anaerobius]